jgi:predicted dehydrogenase
VGTVSFCVAEATAPIGLFLSSDSWRANPEEAPLGPLTALAVHLVDGAIDLFGEIAEVYCVNKRRAAPLVDDTTCLMATHRSGVVSSLLSSQATAGDYRFAVYGTGGLAETERNLDAFRFTPAPAKAGEAPAPEEVIEHKGVNPVQAGLEAFAAAIEGGAPFPITHDQIVHGVAVFEAVVESAKTGRVVTVKS